MSVQRSNEEWRALFQQFESSSLTQTKFCKQHNISTSAFSAKRRLLQVDGVGQQSDFIQAQVVQQTTQYQIAKPVPANMTLCFNQVELSIPQGTSPMYVSELIKELSS